MWKWKTDWTKFYIYWCDKLKWITYLIRVLESIGQYQATLYLLIDNNFIYCINAIRLMLCEQFCNPLQNICFVSIMQNMIHMIKISWNSTQCACTRFHCTQLYNICRLLRICISSWFANRHSILFSAFHLCLFTMKIRTHFRKLLIKHNWNVNFKNYLAFIYI